MKCRFCEKVFTKTSNVKRHELICKSNMNAQKTSVTCSKCMKELSSDSALKKHAKICKRENHKNVFTCSKCQKPLSDQFSLSRHEKLCLLRTSTSATWSKPTSSGAECECGEKDVKNRRAHLRGQTHFQLYAKKHFKNMTLSNRMWWNKYLVFIKNIAEQKHMNILDSLRENESDLEKLIEYMQTIGPFSVRIALKCSFGKNGERMESAVFNSKTYKVYENMTVSNALTSMYENIVHREDKACFKGKKRLKIFMYILLIIFLLRFWILPLLN